MQKSKARRWFRNDRGAALVEYVAIFAILAITIPAAVLLSDDVENLYDGPFGLEPPTGGPVEVVVEGCVATGQCAAPPELVEKCVEDFGFGVRCGEFPLVPIEDENGEFFAVPLPGSADPIMSWALSYNNEDFNPPVYANDPYDGASNTAALSPHPIIHPAADYCAGRGMFLPSISQLKRMSYHKDALEVWDSWYFSSTQWWTPGGYEPNAAVFIPNNWVRVYNLGLGPAEVNIVRYAGVTPTKFVRCIY